MEYLLLAGSFGGLLYLAGIVYFLQIYYKLKKCSMLAIYSAPNSTDLSVTLTEIH